jgi:hypothetical protein
MSAHKLSPSIFSVRINLASRITQTSLPASALHHSCISARFRPHRAGFRADLHYSALGTDYVHETKVLAQFLWKEFRIKRKSQAAETKEVIVSTRGRVRNQTDFPPFPCLPTMLMINKSVRLGTDENQLGPPKTKSMKTRWLSIRGVGKEKRC